MLSTLFSLLTAATLGYIYWSTRDQIESQVDARLRLESDVLINLYKSGALPELQNALAQRNNIDQYGRFYYLSSAEQGALAGPAGWPLRITTIRTHSTVRLGDLIQVPEDSPVANRPVRVAETQLAEGLKLFIGHEISDEQALLDHTFALVVTASIVTILFAIVGGGVVGYNVVRRVGSISRTANDIMDGDLSHRIQITGRYDEFDILAARINEMLDRIEDLMHGMQQVTSNVAHDLRSPLNRLRNRLEVTLLEKRDNAEYRGIMQQAIEDADGLINTFNALLSIARLESGVDKSHWTEVHLGDLAEELSELYEPVAEESNITFHSEISANPTVTANRHLIAQALTNLLDNAIKYAGSGSDITLLVNQIDNKAVLSVRDNGGGIDKIDRNRVLKQFVRLETERNTPGNGLGLSLVKAICQFHSATLTLADNEPGLAATIEFDLRKARIS
ncbi:MAG: HAMP domain-containing sensor histidine kinase [Pseudomonadota bacterium]